MTASLSESCADIARWLPVPSALITEPDTDGTTAGGFYGLVSRTYPGGRNVSEPIFERVWDAFTERIHHAHYHQHDTTATPATEAPAMSLLTTVENEIHALADHARKIEQEVIPAAVSGAKDVEQLAASPVGQALLSIAHVPAGAIERLLIPAISFLAEAFPAPGAADPAVADPAMGQQPEPEPEPAA